jgi:PIN domain nuclease of toxin-antitoxin system
MRLLLDTHVYLWVVMGSPRLTAAARSAIETAEQTFVSAASIWEIGIKARLGKIEADPDELVAAIEQSGFAELPVRAVHAAAAARLPMHHDDPFDRLLVAQALTEPVRLMTADTVLARYGDLITLI